MKNPHYRWIVMLVLAITFLEQGIIRRSQAKEELYRSAKFGVPSFGLELKENLTLLSLDDRLLPFRENLCLYLTKPEVRREPVLIPSRDNPLAPDSMAAHFYGTVLFDEGHYRMWYYPVSLRAAPEDLRQGPICYAESEDGLVWTKPNLGQVEFLGSKDNNAILLPGDQTQCAAVIRDDADRNPARRYKMVYTVHNGTTWVFRTATSSDGIVWKAAPDFAESNFLEMGSFFRHGGLYIVHGQGMGYSEGGHPEGRAGYASLSTDFDHWMQPYARTFNLPEPTDPDQRGLIGDYPQVHLGVGGADFGSYAIGLYGRWHNPAPEQRNRKGWYGAGLITCDFGLLISNDGIEFREPVKDAVFLSSKDSPATPAPGKDDPTILCQANGILNVGDETRIYHGRWRNARLTSEDYYAEVGLATLPRDRWGALGLVPDATEGEVWSAPIALPDKAWSMFLNADQPQGFSVDLADEKFRLLPESSGENSGRCESREGLEARVVWSGKDFSALSGKMVRFRIRVKRDGDSEPRFFAVYLRKG